MTRVPIVPIDDILVATVLEDLSDQDAIRLQHDLCLQIERNGAVGVLLDLSVVEIVDSFLGRLISEVVASSRLLGAETVVVGIQPAVAITLVELGLDLRGVRTALTPKKGRRLLNQLIAASRSGIRHGH
ncbi:MAG TPA: STAS domain-containing protein [Thermomicrobiales bacterium]|nr:STAS domain-containing protein [Thermomicrobiales bacterium]